MMLRILSSLGNEWFSKHLNIEDEVSFFRFTEKTDVELFVPDKLEAFKNSDVALLRHGVLQLTFVLLLWVHHFCSTVGLHDDVVTFVGAFVQVVFYETVIGGFDFMVKENEGRIKLAI